MHFFLTNMVSLAEIFVSKTKYNMRFPMHFFAAKNSTSFAVIDAAVAGTGEYVRSLAKPLWNEKQELNSYSQSKTGFAVLTSSSVRLRDWREIHFLEIENEPITIFDNNYWSHTRDSSTNQIEPTHTEQSWTSAHMDKRSLEKSLKFRPVTFPKGPEHSKLTLANVMDELLACCSRKNMNPILASSV